MNQFCVKILIWILCSHITFVVWRPTPLPFWWEMYPNFLQYHLCSMENPDSLLFGGICAQIFCSITIVNRRIYTPYILLANVPKFSAMSTLCNGEYRFLPFWWQMFPTFCNITFVVVWRIKTPSILVENLPKFSVISPL